MSDAGGDTGTPFRQTCIDAVLFRGLDPVCDIDTDSNNDGSIDAEDDPGENSDAGPGRIVTVGSPELAEVTLRAGVDAAMASAYDWRLCLYGGEGLEVYSTPDGQGGALDIPEGGEWLSDDASWDITDYRPDSPLEIDFYVDGETEGTTCLEASLVAFQKTSPKYTSVVYCDGDYYDADKMTVMNVPVNLTIYDGQNGNAVPDAQDESRGAFTVANMNDTDGDGVRDNVDVNGVIATPFGKDEVDLMRLVLSRPPSPFWWTVTLSVPSGEIILWRESTKVHQIPVDGAGMARFRVSDYPPGGGPLTVWAEAYSPSQSVGDIHITMSYLGVSDEVHATAVWASVVNETRFEHSTRTASSLWADPTWGELDVNDGPRKQTEFNGGTGLRPIDDTYGVCNGMLMQFTVQPADIVQTQIVSFDITRRVEDTIQYYWDHEPNGWESKTLPKKLDQANDDDPEEADETLSPNTNAHMYVADAPGTPWVASGYRDEMVWHLNAWEYMRVTIAKPRPAGNTLSGSRASDKYLWHCSHHLVASGPTPPRIWSRTTGDDEVYGQNDVGPGHIPLY